MKNYQKQIGLNDEALKKLFFLLAKNTCLQGLKNNVLSYCTAGLGIPFFAK